ncbi:ABC transporter ATP-binding protein [Actinocatenispora comari]|uniref:ABC transporter ATP-binding protein n=1 Tax=Actinocatenispora comari TaxID=2807577 RepID=A0A8J4AC14_9ACTN|nr:ABC transporter ATP-binding protein [Actinocatenispora comari]GIL26945.1 ABC transporter ATP-binding protein [Actinocatenispora comari]
MVAAPALSAAGLAVGYPQRCVLSDVGLGLTPGTVTVLVGPNGCGKSTLLRTLAGLQPALAGTVRIGADELTGLSRRELARRLAFLPQSPLVPAGVAVHDLVRHGRYAHRGALRRHTADDRAAVDWALAVTHADELADRRIDELSGGERQRAWLATVLAQQAGVLLLDEPTTYLDLRHQLEVLEVVRGLARDHGIACGLVLHDLGQAAGYADHAVLAADGGVVAAGTPDEVFTAAHIRRAFELDVAVVRDPESGHLALFPRLDHDPASATADAGARAVDAAVGTAGAEVGDGSGDATPAEAVAGSSYDTD